MKRGMNADVVYAATQRIPEDTPARQRDDKMIVYVVNFAPETSVERRIIARIKASFLRMGVPARFLLQFTVADIVEVAKGAVKHLAQ